jgi:hypothetical protein
MDGENCGACAEYQEVKFEIRAGTFMIQVKFGIPDLEVRKFAMSAENLKLQVKFGIPESKVRNTKQLGNLLLVFQSEVRNSD